MPLMVLPLIILYSCKKEKNNIIVCPPPGGELSELTTDPMPLAVGNYWIYETYRIDTLGNETLLSSIDSVYIDRDTIINGYTYYIIEGGSVISHVFNGSALRNNGTDILSLNTTSGLETVVFTPINQGFVYHTDTFSSPPYNIEINTKLSTGFVSKTVAAGTYNCYEMDKELVDLTMSFPYYPRNEYRYYEQSVGIVAGQYFFASSPMVFEMRLVRYNLN